MYHSQRHTQDGPSSLSCDVIRPESKPEPSIINKTINMWLLGDIKISLLISTRCQCLDTQRRVLCLHTPILNLLCVQK